MCVVDHLNLVHLKPHFSFANHVTQVSGFRPCPFTFLDIQGQPHLLSLLMDPAEVLGMVFPGSAEDDHIIQVGCTAVFAVLQHTVHKAHKTPNGMTVNWNKPIGVLKVV